jgi:hypothetical protein
MRIKSDSSLLSRGAFSAAGTAAALERRDGAEPWAKEKDEK